MTYKPLNASLSIDVGKDRSPHLYALCTPTNLQALSVVVDGFKRYRFSRCVHTTPGLFPFALGAGPRLTDTTR